MRDIEFCGNPKPVCPYCKHAVSEWWDHGLGQDESEAEIECGDCGATFIAITNVSISFDTKKVECEDGLHDWGPGEATRISQPTCDRWNAEAFIRKTDWTPHASWRRHCKNCGITEHNHEQHAIDSTDPWGATP